MIKDVKDKQRVTETAGCKHFIQHMDTQEKIDYTINSNN